MLQINQFIDHDRLITAVGMYRFQNEVTSGREKLYFYSGCGHLTDGTAVEIIFFTDCSMEADEHAHKIVDADGNDTWWVTPHDLIKGLSDGTYRLVRVELYGLQTELAKEQERMRATGDYDDEVPF